MPSGRSLKLVGVLTAALLAAALLGCGGGTSAPASNPVPTISNLSPNTATRGGPALTLTVNGSNFVSGAAVQWNGSARQTNFVNAVQVTAQISADDILVAGTENVSVINPGPGGGASNSLSFNIPCVLASPTPASSQTIARLGVYYFDGWAGSYSSYHLKQIVNSAYQDREPLSGWRDDNTCAVEQQLAWAHSFGLDFFIFDWASDSFIAADPGENVNSAIEITHSLPDRHGMQYAIFAQADPVFLGPANWTASVEEWVDYMADPAYLRVNRKPYLALFDIKTMRQLFGSSAAVTTALDQIRTAAQAKGLPGVYIAGLFWVAEGFTVESGIFTDLSMASADGYDAVSMYNYPMVTPETLTGAQPFSILAEAGSATWDQGALKSPLPFIPVAMDGWDPRPTDPQAPFWFTRSSQDFTTFVSNAITWADSTPQVRPEPSPSPPLVVLEAWNELGEGGFIVPTVGEGTSYGDALAAMLATPPARTQSALTLADSGPSDPSRTASGHLTDETGAPVAGASITLSAAPVSGVYAQYQISGTPPPSATQAVVGFRVNSQAPWPGGWDAGPANSNFSLYQVAYVQPSDGIQRVVNGDFSAGAQSWTLQGQTQIVPSDRGSGQMVQVAAVPSQSAWLDAAPFPVTGGTPFQLTFSARVTPASLGSGYFMLYFLDASGSGPIAIPGPNPEDWKSETTPLVAEFPPIGTATTDTTGSFQFSLTSLGTSQVTLKATYAGDAQHWPAYAQTGP